MYSQITKLPFGYTAEFSWRNGHFYVAWEPDVPKIRSARHQQKFILKYEKERDEFLGHVATLLNGPVLVSDMDGNMKTIYPSTRH